MRIDERRRKNKIGTSPKDSRQCREYGTKHSSNELAFKRAKTLAEKTMELIAPQLRGQITIGAKTNDRNINYFGYEDAGYQNLYQKTVIIYLGGIP